jgi:hypothetical protein
MKTLGLMFIVMIGLAFPAYAKVVRTDFEPMQHGFGFKNSFRNVGDLGVVKVVTKGRCGGMVYGALDHYLAGKRIPNQMTAPNPDVGDPLAQYLLDRQLKSTSDMGPKFLDKLAQQLSPFTSDKDMFLSGIDYINGIRISVDKGRPIPVGLIPVEFKVVNSHIVLAIGYETHPNPHGQKVLVYDPNHPRVVTVLTPDPPRDCFRDQHGNVYRTLFNSDKYEQRRPLETWAPSRFAGMTSTRGTNGTTVVWRGIGGGIGTTSVGPDGKWRKTRPIAPANAARPGSPVATVIGDGDYTHDFWIGPDGGIGTTFAAPDQNYATPFPIAPPNAARADSPLAAVYRGDNQIDVYWIGPDGAIATTFTIGGKWATPFPITRPGEAGGGSGLAALSRDKNLVEVFWVAPDGGVRTNYSNKVHNQGKWAEPFNIAPANGARPGSPVAAASMSLEDAHVFWIGPDGGVGTTQNHFHKNSSKWARPYPIAPPNATRKDSPLIAVSRVEGVLQVAWIGGDGAIAIADFGSEAWKEPFPITPPNTAGAGSVLGLTSRLPHWLDVFFVGNDGAVATSYWSALMNDAKWNTAFPLSGPGEAVR